MPEERVLREMEAAFRSNIMRWREVAIERRDNGAVTEFNCLPWAFEAASAPALSPLKLHYLLNASALGRRELHGTFVLNPTAAISENSNGSVRLEAITIILVERIALEPELIARHIAERRRGIVIFTAIEASFLRFNLLNPIPLSCSKWHLILVLDKAATIPEIFNGLLRLKAVTMPFVI